MPTARGIIEDALTFGLNRLSPGEAMDADLAAMALRGLNSVLDEVNGGLLTLWREILVTGTVTTSPATFTAVWPTMRTGDPVLGATYSTGGMDVRLSQITIQQYHETIAVKTTAGPPMVYAYDGAESIYFYPVPVGYSVTLRTQEMRPDFADLDTDYVMPDGWRSGLAALLAEKIAPPLLGGVPADVTRKASAAKTRLSEQSLRPGMINGGPGTGNILTNWRN